MEQTIRSALTACSSLTLPQQPFAPLVDTELFQRKNISSCQVTKRYLTNREKQDRSSNESCHPCLQFKAYEAQKMREELHLAKRKRAEFVSTSEGALIGSDMAPYPSCYI